MVVENDDKFNVIQPKLLQQLKAILDQYPDDGQILKVIFILLKSLKTDLSQQIYPFYHLNVCLR